MCFCIKNQYLIHVIIFYVRYIGRKDGQAFLPSSLSLVSKLIFLSGSFVARGLFFSSNKVITIKAKVYKPETFALVDPPEVMRLEPCLVGEPLSAKPPGEARVLLRNTTPRRRLFVIEGQYRQSVAGWMCAFRATSGSL